MGPYYCHLFPIKVPLHNYIDLNILRFTLFNDFVSGMVFTIPVLAIYAIHILDLTKRKTETDIKYALVTIFGIVALTILDGVYGALLVVGLSLAFFTTLYWSDALGLYVSQGIVAVVIPIVWTARVLLQIPFDEEYSQYYVELCGAFLVLYSMALHIPRVESTLKPTLAFTILRSVLAFGCVWPRWAASMIWNQDLGISFAILIVLLWVFHLVYEDYGYHLSFPLLTFFATLAISDTTPGKFENLYAATTCFIFAFLFFLASYKPSAPPSIFDSGIKKTIYREVMWGYCVVASVFFAQRESAYGIASIVVSCLTMLRGFMSGHPYFAKIEHTDPRKGFTLFIAALVAFVVQEGVCTATAIGCVFFLRIHLIHVQ